MTRTPRIWTWMHTHVEDEDSILRERLRRLKEGGVDAVFLLVYDGRKAFYKSSQLPVEQDELHRVLELAAPLDLQVHAWMFTLNCNVEEIREDHPDWFVVNRNGKSTLEERPYVEYYNWLCPSRDQVREYVLAILRELGRVRGLAGIHLDYIRFPDVILPKGLHAHYNLVQDRELPEYDYCYCRVCRRNFEQRYGRDPLKLDDAPQDREWRRYREDLISALVDLAVREIHGAEKLASAAVFATPDLARTLVRQDWTAWPLDAVFPMIYHHFYTESPEWIEIASREGVRALPESRPLYAGIFVGELPDEQLGEAVKLALRGGARGVSLFSAEALTEKQLEVLARVKADTATWT